MKAEEDQDEQIEQRDQLEVPAFNIWTNRRLMKRHSTIAIDSAVNPL